MLRRRSKIQLVAFVLIALVGMVYAGGKYAGLGRLFGFDGYNVTVKLSDSGGIFTNAEVSYRGVPVGRVKSLRLTDTGVAVTVNVDNGSYQIPASSRAVVADRSAVGEQYIDLEPPNDHGPYLHDGSVIPEKRTNLPPTPQSLLSNLDKLATSVPTKSLRTVVDEAGEAFRGTGPELQRLLDAANSFTATAEQHVPQTKGLLSSGRTVLSTQRAETGNLNRFSHGLNQITTQLADSDADLRTLIEQAPGAAEEIDDVLRTSGNDLSMVLANLLTVTKVAAPRTANLKELLVGLPVIGGFSPTVSRNHQAHLSFVLDFFNPLPCTRGYEGTHQQPGTDTAAHKANTEAYCAEPKGSPIEVRGAQNAPYAGVPSSPESPGQDASQQEPSQQPTKPDEEAAQAAGLPGVLGRLGGDGAQNLGQLMGLSG